MGDEISEIVFWYYRGKAWVVDVFPSPISNLTQKYREKGVCYRVPRIEFDDFWKQRIRR